MAFLGVEEWDIETTTVDEVLKDMTDNSNNIIVERLKEIRNRERRGPFFSIIIALFCFGKRSVDEYKNYVTNILDEKDIDNAQQGSARYISGDKTKNTIWEEANHCFASHSGDETISIFIGVFLEANMWGESVKKDKIEKLMNYGSSDDNDYTNTYKWTKFYEALASELYDDGFEGELIRKIRNVEKLELQSVNYLDPFTIFASFNRLNWLKGNRSIIIELIKEINKMLKSPLLELPTECELCGVYPLGEGDRFFLKASTDNEENCKILWKLFNEVKADEYGDGFVEAFNQARNIGSIRDKLTIGLSWIKPYKYIGLGTQTQNLLKNPDGKRYVDYLQGEELKKLMNEKRVLEFPELTYELMKESKSTNGGCEMGNKDVREDIINIVTPIVNDNDSDKKKQIIFTGAPGTGKTFCVREFVKEQDENYKKNKYEKEENEEGYKFVQFHPSYDYTDFVEGLRPVRIDDDNNPTFVRIDGVFKKFCRYIVKKNLEVASQIDEIDDFVYTFGGNVDETAKEKKELDALKNKERIEAFFRYFKERDNETRDTDDLIEKYKDISEKFSFGERMYYFVIDEINRADLSKVFGELMFGLEETYRGIENRFDTQYMNLKTFEVDEKSGKASPMKFDCFERGFFIPHNLCIIGTMNDIDRSVDSMDFALRRRFDWIDIKANEIMKESLNNIFRESIKRESNSTDNEISQGNLISVSDFAEKIIKMNKVICNSDNDSEIEDNGSKLGLNEAYHIGPAYFKKLKCVVENGEIKIYNGSLEEVFYNNIVSILHEYTRGRKQEDVEKLIKECAIQLGIDYPNTKGV